MTGVAIVGFVNDDVRNSGVILQSRASHNVYSCVFLGNIYNVRPHAKP